MKTSVEKLEGTNIKLTVTSEVAEVDKAIEGAYKKIASKVKVPGFRPGKAPRAVLDNAVGRDYILAEATEDLVNDSYPLAIDIEKLRPIEAPEMPDLDTVKPGEEYTYVAEVELRPELTLTSIDDLSVQLPPREASDEEVDVQINQFRDRFATLEPVEDRGVEADDHVLISFVGTVDGEEYEGNVVDKYLYEMSHGLMPVEFDEGLLGAKPGDVVHIEFAVPDTSSNPDFVGKTAEFEVTVHEIKKKVLPEIDDEFASNVGGFDTVEELRENVKQGLDVQRDWAWQRERETAVRAELSNRLVGDVPEAMIESKKGRLLRDLETQLAQRDMSLPDYLAATGVTMERIDQDSEAQAIQLVREDLALEALFRQLEWEVTDEDLDKELEDMAKGSNETPEDLRKRWQEMGLTQVIVEEVMHRRAIEWLHENVEIIEVPAEMLQADGDEGAGPAVEDMPEQAGSFDVEPAAESADEAETE